MSIATLIRRMAEAGAPPEAIAIAVEAIEAEAEARKAPARERKRRQRELSRNVTVTVTGQGRDSHGKPSLSPPPSPEPPTTTSNLSEYPPISPQNQGRRRLRTTPEGELVERLWALQPVVGGKRKATRPDVAKALGAALARGGDPTEIELAFRAYYALPDCRKDGGQFAKGAAVLLNEDRWRDFLPRSAPERPPPLPAPEEIRRRLRHWRDTGEWKPAWGLRPDDLERTAA